MQHYQTCNYSLIYYLSLISKSGYDIILCRSREILKCFQIKLTKKQIDNCSVLEEKFLNSLKERIVQRLKGWKEKFLSKAGREVLIKAIAQSIPTYAMNCFQLPKTWCDEISSLISSYWWGQ